MARPAEPRRKVPMKIQLWAALYQLGLEPTDAELDHFPALALRPIDPVTGEHQPHQHDPRALIWRSKADHRAKTFGTGATTRGADAGEIAHTRRLTKKEAEFQARLLAKDVGETPEPRRGRRLQGGRNSHLKKRMDGTVVQRRQPSTGARP
ncbi:hypothetical protein [Enterovirga rhinocerotis]|uniref:Uncharacterized protein n=1 Tax=Enterovirga rhinocerotis TaxID=1339210 RepID=A0A4R7BWT4_9HYPH|nr:hypothetical protein [Enterovirga rhinocerotis]TDR90344.1 hypothetical protein EV668_3195 [Enterovirga rhinocerotis]